MPPKILIHEYFTGGGWSAPDLPPDLASEGLAMLCSAVDDFSKWGGAAVYTTLDKRLAGTSLAAGDVKIIDPAGYSESISRIAAECAFALIIAPETNGILSALNKQMRDEGITLLGSDPDAIRVTGNKWVCHKILSNAGLPVPETVLVTCLKPAATKRDDVLGAAYEIGFPLVIKPVDGVGCEGVNLVMDMKKLRDILESAPAFTGSILLQEYIRGEHLSVSILSTGKNFLLLSLNRQHIEEGMPFRYNGGEIMPAPGKGDDLHNLIGRILNIIPGLKGYFGIDLIKTGAGYKIIEINPRLTTSYVGLRKVININLAGAMFNAVTNGILPELAKINKNKVFNKGK